MEDLECAEDVESVPDVEETPLEWDTDGFVVIS